MLSSFSCVCRFFTCFFFAVWFHNRLPLRPDTLYCTAYIPGMCLCIQLLLLSLLLLLLLCVLQYCCCCCSCSCLPPLFIIVCRMAKLVADSLNLIPVFSFSSFKHDFFSCTHRQYGCMYRLDLTIPNTTKYIHFSVITVMCGAKPVVSPPRRSPPSTTTFIRKKSKNRKASAVSTTDG